MQEIPGGLHYQSGGVLPDSSPFKSGCATPRRLSTANSSPSAKSFTFTPTRGRRLYPLLDAPASTVQIRASPGTMPENLADESYINKDYSSSFISAMDNLEQQMFSSNITNNVLNEFNHRYDQVRQEKVSRLEAFNSKTSNEELNRRASGRFSRDHRHKFNRMESINTHYAARRGEQNSKIPPRKLIPVDRSTSNEKENMSAFDKRLQNQLLESASKRMKKLDGNFKELHSSPTKSLEQKQDLLNYYQVKLEKKEEKLQPLVKPLAPPTLEKKEKGLPSYLLPTKASLQKSTSNIQISPSKSSLKIEPVPPPSLSHSVSSRISNSSSFAGGLKKSPTKNGLSSIITPTPATQLKKSPSISPTKISPSKGSSNLNALLKGDGGHAFSSTPISRSRTTGNFASGLPKPSIPTSASNRSFSSKTLTGSSSIPRLVSLANSEKLSSRKKGWNY